MASASAFSFHRSRSARLGHHFDQGKRWLDGITSHEDTTAISYAGFEFWLEIELRLFVNPSG